ARPALIDAARTLGVSSRWASWTMARALVLPTVAAAGQRVAARMALGVGLAIILAPTSTSRTLGPGLLDLAAEPDGLRRAGGIALAAWVVDAVSLAWAAGR